ncbi:transcriptional regulator [Ktedonobacter sp. SOSP1-52]|uniref:ArsR/SmtB family transcription factor n=1 Tax=Ktedonobacter sp. SOSP1-52 TaxID=2778366 RepID=UPI001915632E|nr:transcriptional regulator [Ktedonobacter sp. SOSP1-52]GHO64525.1 transcriptional regulator [Ktedonobacter sp. SOSP1-52]
MRDELVLETPEQIRALAHPLRQRVLGLLTNAPYTNKQLANLLQVSPPRLHFHVRELQAAGLIEIVSQQPKGGVIEKYYRAVARVVRLAPETKETARDQELVESTLEALSQEYIRANTFFNGHIPEMRFAHELVRLPADRLARIQELLDAVGREIYQALEDPERDTYEQFVAVSYLLHRLPPVSMEREMLR